MLIQKQHPELDIRFVFTNENSRLNKKSKTTYGNWCEKYNFKYATKLVPIEWVAESSIVLSNNKFIKFKGDKKC